MSIMRRQSRALVAVALVLGLCASAYGQWVTGFFPGDLGKVPVSAIPWSAYTHMIYFAAAPGPSGTVNPQYAVQPEMANIVAAAHSHGVKIIIAISDNGGGSFLTDTTSGVIATFVSNVVSFVNTNNFDGVDYDWEAATNVSQYEDLLARTRTALPSPKLITTDVYNGSGLLETIMGASHANIDQVNAMCYDMDIGSSYTWHNDALFQNGDTSKSTCDWRVNAFISHGVPASKMGAGLPLYGRHWTHTNAPLQTGGTMVGGNVDYSFLVTSGLINSTNQRWDASYSADYLSIAATNEFYSYNGVRSVDALVSWGKSRSLGGFMTFALDHEYISGGSGAAGQFPISTRLFNDVFVASSSPPTISSFTSSPASIFPGGSSTLSWASTGGTSCSIDHGVGTVSCNSGSTPVSPSVTTIYTFSATNSSGTTPRAATVTVTAPTIASFSASPATVASGGLSTLSWSTSGATSCSINQGVGTVTCGSSSVGVHPTANTAYQLTATNSVGPTTATATVTVTTAPHSSCNLILQ